MSERKSILIFMAGFVNQDDFLKVLREHPEWKQAVRMEILGEELLSLPDLVKENSRQIAENSRQIAENSRQIAALTERVDENSRQIAALTERMDENSRQIAELTQTVRRLDSRLGHLDGRFTEEVYRQAFATKVVNIDGKIRRVKIFSRSEQVDLSFDAADEGLITEDEASELSVADVVAEGRIRSTGEMVTLVAEIAVTVHKDDVTRALRRAEVASRATKRRCIPVVMGERAEVIRDTSYPGVWLVERDDIRELTG